MRSAHTLSTDEHELPGLEAMFAATLALMTGYGQALLADLHPEQRLVMGARVADNLALLAEHPQLTEGFHHIVLGLRDRWQLMSACTAQTEPAPRALACAAPGRLQ